MAFIVCQVEEAPTKGQLLVVWRKEGNPFAAPYTIDVGMLERKGKEIRDVLAVLVNECLNGQTLQCGPVLKNLARSGHALYRALFPQVYPNIPQMVANSIGKLLRRGESCKIKFLVESRIHIPWGLMYDADPEQLSGQPADMQFERFGEFWCHKYAASTMYHNIVALSDLPRDRQTFRIVGIHNKSVFDDVLTRINDPRERAVQKAIYEQLSVIYSKEALLRNWNDIRKSLGIMLFYCHANEMKLALGENDTIDIDDLRQEFVHTNWEGEPPITLVFLNGCSTAVGARDGGFLEATGGPGFCGFIGTETEVPDLFALRFSLAFLYYFLFKGLPAVDAMATLRRAHWPLSSLYSLYCHPTLAVAPLGDNAEIEAWLSQQNFSSPPVGGRKI